MITEGIYTPLHQSVVWTQLPPLDSCRDARCSSCHASQLCSNQLVSDVKIATMELNFSHLIRCLLDTSWWYSWCIYLSEAGQNLIVMIMWSSQGTPGRSCRTCLWRWTCGKCFLALCHCYLNLDNGWLSLIIFMYIKLQPEIAFLENTYVHVYAWNLQQVLQPKQSYRSFSTYSWLPPIAA